MEMHLLWKKCFSFGASFCCKVYTYLVEKCLRVTFSLKDLGKGLDILEKFYPMLYNHFIIKLNKKHSSKTKYDTN